MKSCALPKVRALRLGQGRSLIALAVAAMTWVKAVRRNLKIQDELGFHQKRGCYSGRVLTPLYSGEPGGALADDRIGFVDTRIEEYIFKTSFDPKAGCRDAIASTSIIDKQMQKRSSRYWCAPSTQDTP